MVRNGRLVLEEYFHRYRADEVRTLRSVSTAEVPEVTWTPGRR